MNSTPPVNQDNTLADAINKLVISNAHKDINIIHIQPFSGEGSSTTVATKLTYFLNDMDELGKETPITEHKLLLLAKQKLTGAARALVSMSRPATFSDLVQLLTTHFSGVDGDHEVILQQLKEVKIQSSQNFIQLATKSKELAVLAAQRLKCQTSSKIVFDAFAKGLLANFQPYIKVQNDISKAITRMDCDELINVLHQLLKTDQSILIKPESSGINRINNQRPHHNKQNVEVKCQICNHNGHLALDCPKFKDKAVDRHVNYGHQNRSDERGTEQQPFSRSAGQNYYRGQNYRNYNSQYYVPNNQYYGRTPRFYQPRHDHGYRPRNYTPVGPRNQFRFNNNYQNNRRPSEFYQQTPYQSGQCYQTSQQPPTTDVESSNFQMGQNNSNPG